MDEWEAMPLSSLAQAAYCLRRAALLTNEQVWIESVDTAKGRTEHERVHDERVERRGNEIKLYEHAVFSDELNISGKCDCVECVAAPDGCHIPAADFPVRLYPVEYKHGKVRDEESYEIQLCAQAMCLEEMYRTRIPEGAIFYITAHQRKTVMLDDGLRERVRQTVVELERMRRTFDIPAARYGPKCKRCSIRENCMPEVGRSAAAYCRTLEQEAKAVEAL